MELRLEDALEAPVSWQEDLSLAADELERLGLLRFDEGSASGELPMCGRNAVQVHPHQRGTVDLDRLATRLDGTARSIERSAQMLRFATGDAEFTVFRSGRALVFGTDDTQRARILYDRYVGL